MDYLRQLGILDPELFSYPITLIGCGGIGSPTALTLAKVGCSDLILIDPDSVEEHNLPNQVFRLEDIGRSKVSACKEIIADFSPCKVTAIQANVDHQPLAGIVISAVDSMAARRIIWEKLKFNTMVPLYIDGRIGGEVMELFTFQPFQITDIEFYEEFMFSDEEAAELSCTARSIMYTGFVIGGLIVSQLAKWLRQDKYFRRINFDLKTMTMVMA